MPKLRAPWACAPRYATWALEARASEQGHSFRLFLLHLRFLGRCQGAAQTCQSLPGCILFRILLRRSCSACERFAWLTIRGFQPHFDQEALAMIGSAFALHSIHRRTG